MKFFVPIFAAAVAAAPFAEEAVTAPVVHKRQAVVSNEQGVKILPRFSETQPKDGAKRTTVKYGTWSVSSTKMLSTTKLAKGPCGLSDCLVTAMEATIRYPDGKEANVDTGAWLHHIALFGVGGGSGSLWASGNERPTLRLNSQSKFGLDFPNSFMLMVDLMTESSTPKSLTLEITYEHVPAVGSGYKKATMYWLTIGEPAAKSGVYSFKTLPTTSMVTGSLLYTIGHMHDGGTDMQLFINNKLVCKSIMHYSPLPGAGDMAGMDMGSGSMAGMSHGRRQEHGHAMGSGEHISAPGACTDFGSVKTGDRLVAEAWYDAKKHPLMEMNGKKERLMGNMRVYIGGGGIL